MSKETLFDLSFLKSKKIIKKFLFFQHKNVKEKNERFERKWFLLMQN